MTTGQSMFENAEHGNAVDGGTPVHVLPSEVLKRWHVLRLNGERISGEDSGPFVGRFGIPQLGASTEEGNWRERINVLSTPLLHVDGGVAIAEEGGNEEAAA